MYDTKKINEKVYEIRGKRVIMDADLAELFNYANGAKTINQVVKRHSESFNEGIYFQLTKEEFTSLRSQLGTANGTKKRNLPYVFTDEGVRILTSFLRSLSVKEVAWNVIECLSNKENYLSIKTPKIEGLIYEIRGQQVMLDVDLAMLYEVETKRINEAVKNNPIKFPERFSWILDREDFENLRSKFSTSSLTSYGGRRYNYRVFTEQGVAMLATILKSTRAAQISIQIMDAFVMMRKYISTNLIEQRFINNQVMINAEEIKRQAQDIRMLQEYFSKFDEKRKVNEIYFKGQIYDAYSKLLSIFREAKHSLVIVDRYADQTVLDMISKVTVQTTLIVKNKPLISQLDIEKYESQYDNLFIVFDDTFHDRYILIDGEIVYHCGTSINHAGSKTFSINMLEDEIVTKTIFEFVYDISKRCQTERK